MKMEFLAAPWQTLSTVPVANLVDTKAQLHWAAQIVAAFGNTLLQPQPDDSQSNLGWVNSYGAICSHPTSGWMERRPSASQIVTICCFSILKQYLIQTEFGLHGRTLQQGLEWLTLTYSKFSGAPPPNPLRLREYDMPSHPVGNNAAFQLHHGESFQELQHWYGNAHQVIRAVSREVERSLTHSMLAALF